MPDITVSALGLDYSGKKAIDNVGFTAHNGELLTLLGPSGCGKTTTLMSIAGLTRPTRGTITCGDDVLFDSTRSIDRPPERRNCGVVFQSYAIWPHKSVAENVAYPLQLRKVGKNEVRSRVHQRTGSGALSPPNCTARTNETDGWTGPDGPVRPAVPGTGCAGDRVLPDSRAVITRTPDHPIYA